MPKRKRGSKPHTARSRKRRRMVKKAVREYKSRTTNVIHTRGPVAPRTIVKLKYNEAFSSDGAAIDYKYNLNSIFDPNLTGTGHQPYGHDTYSTLYNRYRVFAVKVILKSVCASGVYKVAMLANNSTSSETNITLASEKPGTITKVIEYGQGATFYRKYSLPRVNGQTPAEYKGDARFQAIFGSSPGENLVLHIVHTGMDNSTPASGAVAHMITLVYYCELFDPLELGQS